MLIYQIPGREEIIIENLVLDYNGTIAYEGLLLDGVEEILNLLSDKVNVYIVTADTFGSVRKECQAINGKILTFPKENAGIEKLKIVESLGRDRTISIGNGFNDKEMFEATKLSIGIIGQEGFATASLKYTDILFTNIIDGLMALEDSEKIKATLRN